MLAAVLRQRGLIVDEAEDGAAALDLIRANRYTVVLLDLIMPNVDGFAVLKAMRVELLQARPVVLVLTGAERPIVERLDPQLIQGLVKKPFDADELASVVVACTEVRGRGGLAPMAMAMMSSSSILAWLAMKG